MSSFRQIGELCRDVIAEAELRAARQGTAANGSGKPSGVAQLPDAPTAGGMSELGGGTPVREDADVPPRRSNPRGQVRATENGKGRGTVKATASEGRVGRYQRRNVKLASTPAHLRLIVRNDGRGLPHAAAMKGLARPGSRPSIRIVGGTHYTASGSF